MRLVCVALALVGARTAGAERLFVRAAGLPSNARGISRVATIAIDRTALDALRTQVEATLTEFPLGVDGTATLTVERFEPFTAGARAVVVEDDGSRDVALPDQLYYRGRVEGDPASRVLLVATAETARGFVSTGGTIYRFGRDRAGIHRVWALRDADPAIHPGPGEFCANEKHDATLRAHPGRTEASPGTSATPPVAAFAPTLLVQVAIETDQELLSKFMNDTSDALQYLADLAAAVSAIYDADTDVRVKFSFIRLWNTPDPWTASNVGSLLDQFQDYWLDHEGGTPRDVAHFVSGKPVSGGIAYIDVLCDPNFGFGVSEVYGSFDVMDPDDTWDVTVVAHELGHNFGSDHTHCYDPPVDHCYASEPGCYNGPTSLPPGGGTIMSYCHLRSGGQSNIDLTFGPTVSNVLRAAAENGSCVGLPCGDGLLDPGEQCDDGNDTNGDCCAANCTAEADGGACDDGETCTSSDACTGGVCAGTPVTNGTPCTDDSLCTDDTCQAGACVGAPAPAAGCTFPTLPLKSQILLRNKLIDKSDQVSWKWTKGAATTLGDFGSPTTTDDYELCVYAAGPSLLFKGRLPAGGTCVTGPCWKTLPGKGFSYKDRDRSPAGMEKMTLLAGATGSAKVTVKGKGENLVMPTLGSIATPVQVQLRRAGACWAASFSTPILNTAEQFKAKSDPPPP